MRHRLSALALGLAAWIPFATTGACEGRAAPDKGNQSRFTAPSDPETEAARKLIEQAEAALKAGKTATEILTDPAFLPAHEWMPFRKLIRQAGTSSRATLVSPPEPGVPLVVAGRVVDRDGNPIQGAVVYSYHTSAKGWYSDRAAHFSGPEGDRKYARLFGYLTTDATGAFEIKTVRPGGYPDGDLPAHIHLEVGRTGDRPLDLITEIQFDDDSRLTAEWRNRSRQEGFVIAEVKKGAVNTQQVRVELKLR